MRLAEQTARIRGNSETAFRSDDNVRARAVASRSASLAQQAAARFTVAENSRRQVGCRSRRLNRGVEDDRGRLGILEPVAQLKIGLFNILV